MALSTDVVEFCKKFAKALGDGNVAIFAGAGLSVPAGFVDWQKLLAPFAKELELDIERERDNLVRFAQYSLNHKAGNRHHLNEALITAFPTLKAPVQNHEILARLPIATYWTTNYDKLIETALVNRKKNVDVKHQNNQLPTTRPRRDVVVYKMHGDVEHPQDAVLTRDDYERYASKRAGFLNALVGDLTGKTFLFLGFSFADPNLEQVLRQLRQRYQDGQREHFCLLRRPKRGDFKEEYDFTYAQVRQRHFIADLRQYNVTALSIDEHDDITDVLLTIERCYRRRSIFISGSVEDYSPWNEASVHAFFRDLGALLVTHDFRIVTGFGQGVGNSLISGAIEAAYQRTTGRLDDFLEVRPFPRDISDPIECRKIWEAYRRELLSLPGIALFFFGNKIVGGQVVLADGMKQEFEIASAQNLATLPIGATKFVAGELAQQMLSASTSSSLLVERVQMLNAPVEKMEQLLQPILEAVKALAAE